MQLNKKYNFLQNAKVCIDLCAAPGSWAQVAAKYMPVNSLTIAVDLVPIKPLKNVVCLTEDITTEKCRKAIMHEMKNWKADIVLNDGAPNVGANWEKDAYNQSELVIYALKLATQHLREGGWFITKVFRSSDYQAILWACQQLFKKVEATKPQASRNESAEIFVVCWGYKDPKKIDPRLLDPKHVFKEVQTEQKKEDVFHEKLGKRQRGGYEDGVTILYKDVSVADFVKSADPVQMLTDYNAFKFDERSSEYASHKATNDEIKASMADLRVLGKPDFKRLLKWRTTMREAHRLREAEEAKRLKAEAGDAAEEDEDDKSSDDDAAKEDALVDTVEAKRKELERRKKREKKAAREKMRKYRERVDLQMIQPDDKFDAPTDEQLFNLATITSKKGLRVTATTQADSTLYAVLATRPIAVLRTFPLRLVLLSIGASRAHVGSRSFLTLTGACRKWRRLRARSSMNRCGRRKSTTMTAAVMRTRSKTRGSDTWSQ